MTGSGLALSDRRNPPAARPLALILLAFIPLIANGCALKALDQKERTMFTESSMENLSFLEGKWSGEAPDGTNFYESYVWQGPGILQSTRYSDETFTAVTDGSVVEFKDGQITSTWGEYVWRAREVGDGLAAFEPINAPSGFVWRRIDPDTVEVTQNWNDESGAPQSYRLLLRRIF